MESDALDALIAKETGLASGTVQNLRGELRKEGLLRSVPDRKDEDGTVTRWLVVLTNAVES
jgi:hypothetical protein